MRFAFLLLPWLEFFSLIELGVRTSALTAIGYAFITAVIGLGILQRHGRGMFERLREGQEGRMVGPQLLIDDMSLGLAGLLLVFPGLISDCAALLVISARLGTVSSGLLRGSNRRSISRGGKRAATRPLRAIFAGWMMTVSL